MVGRRWDRALLEDDPVGLDALDVAEPDDVLDAAKLLDLPNARRPALHHGRHDRPVGAEHRPRVFEALEYGFHSVRRHHGLELQDDALERAHLTGLEERAVEDPVVAWANPGDVVGIGTSVEQPADR